MDVKKELFKAKVKTHILIRKEDIESGECLTESPYLYPIDDLENIIIKLVGMDEAEVDKLSDEAVDYAWEICHMLNIKEEKAE